MNLANEGFEARKKEEEVTAKKRKAEDDAKWEGEHLVLSHSPQTLSSSRHVMNSETREQRVGSWRSFTNNSKKKKKQKVNLLG